MEIIASCISESALWPSFKFDSLLEEFSDELAHIDLIPPGINETDFDPKEEIRLVEKLLYENSSPRPLEEFNSENYDAIIKSFSPSHIPVEDSDSLMEDIDLFLTPNDSMPPGIENDGILTLKGISFFLSIIISSSFLIFLKARRGSMERNFYLDVYFSFLSSLDQPQKGGFESGYPNSLTPVTNCALSQIVARRANECIVSITEPDYKNLNKNDIEDMYLLIMNGKVPDYAETGLLWSLSVFIRSSVIWERVHDFQLGIESYQQKVNLTAPTISFPGVEKHKMFSIIYEPVHGIIYKNSKKEKRVMRHSEIHKFYDATLIRVLEGLKSYNNDVKYGYVQRELTNDEVEYLKLFEEEIKVRLKYRNQMRRWKMYVNGRSLGPRRERPE
ncbi:hypothetical protein Tco_0924802 [Tanacetum coccineum]|uniref:Uncharacterized protein n=1 Tax=Tanacetum coccineum TaxID=301880 RepID=A0ABQ5D720_9ASTR